MLFGLLSLSSCGPSPQATAMNQFHTLVARCAAKNPDQPPTMAAYQKCQNAAANATADKFYPYPDIVELVHAERVKIADQADKGQISLDQANIEIAKVDEEATQMALERNNKNSEAAAQRASAAANMWSVLHASQPQPYYLPAPSLPNYAPAQPITTTNCTRFGNQVNCVSR